MTVKKLTAFTFAADAYAAVSQLLAQRSVNHRNLLND